MVLLKYLFIMKKLLFSFFLMTFVVGYAQVGINTTTPSPASVLHVEALNTVTTTYGGFMPPIVDLAQRAAMPVTAADDGLMIYLVDGTTRCVQMYNANIPQWEDMYCMPLPAPTGIIYYQDFETVPNTPELTYTATGGSISTGSAVDPNSSMFSEGTQGYEMTNTGTGGRNIDFMVVDTSLYTTNTFSFDLASFGSVTNGADQTDYIEVFTSTDGGTYTSQIVVQGAVGANTKWSFSGSAVATTTYGTPITIIPVDPSPAASPLSIPDSYSKVVLNGLPSVPTLYLRIKFRNNSADETWCVDNVILNLN